MLLASMDAYFVVGNPVEHSRSPLIHARFAVLTGQTMQYGKRLIPLHGFSAAIKALQKGGVLGCNVTVPFKFEAFNAAHTQSERAQLALAANTLQFKGEHIYADNTDGVGLVNDIQRNAGLSLAGREVLLVGAGGAAAGVLAPLIAAKPSRLVVVNRNPEKANALVNRHLSHASLENALKHTALSSQLLEEPSGNFDVVINATASSLSGAAFPVHQRVLKPGALVYDMMYGPATAPLMRWASEHSAVGRDGLGMLVEQAAESFWLWRGVRPPAAQVLQEIRTGAV